MDLGKALAIAGRGSKMTRKAWNGDGYFGYEDGLLYVRSCKNPEKEISVKYMWKKENVDALDYMEFKEGNR